MLTLIQPLKKYLVFAKIQLGTLMEYRFDLLWRWIQNIFKVLISVILWGATTQPYSDDFFNILLYFILTHGIIVSLHSSTISRKMGDKIKSGELNNILLKPIKFIPSELLSFYPKILARIIIPIILITAATFIYPEYFAPASTGNLMLFILFTGAGAIIWYLLSSIIASIAFWVLEITYLTTTMDLIIDILKGVYIPVFFFPETLQRILQFTPIPYLLAYPISLYTDNYTTPEVVRNSVVVIFWMIVLYITLRIVYKKGLKQYEGYGI